MSQGAYGQRLAHAFRMQAPPTLLSRTQGGAQLAVTELVGNMPGFGFTAPQPIEDAYLIGLQLRGLLRHELWTNGRSVKVMPIGQGTTHIYDMRCNPIAYIEDPFHPLFLYLPRAALTELGDHQDIAVSGELRHVDGVWFEDPVILHLMTSMLPAVRAEQATNALYVDYVLLALRTHLVHAYGDVGRQAQPARGALAPWRERRAKELMRAHVREGISLAELAQACGLSAGTFATLFKRTTGVTPHQWLLQRRVECAIEMMSDAAVSLADVALLCGFADQAHFTRVFSRQVGVSPGAWRAGIAP
ncbi:helix-turn-helix domain-containing protein [Lysobacter sp. TAF61]|uniref:helix-turn-helix domain-containing protein n=1 Tax=Lysobacter sp. TAF61 TaxID=3233072 RepID=UPI003F9BF062